MRSGRSISRDLLLRGTLIRVSDLDHLLVISQHHIASDLWSVRNLHRELEALYEAGVTGAAATLPVLSLQYVEHARNQHSHVRSEAITGQLMNRRQHLAGKRVLSFPRTGRCRSRPRWRPDT